MTTLRDSSLGRALRVRRASSSVALPSPLYGCTIITLAVFFVGLVAWRVPVDAYIVVSQVGCRSVLRNGAGVADTGDGRLYAASRQSLANAIRLADAQLTRESADEVDPITDERMEEVAQGLRIQARAVKPGEQSISIAYSGDDPAWSMALVDVLTRDCLLAAAARDSSPAIAASKVRELRWKAELARHYERKARHELELVMETNAERHAIANATPEGDSGDGSGMAASTPEGAVEYHPQWVALQQELSAMANQLQTLLITLTPNHPQVQALTQQMEAVRRQLDLTPKYWTPDITPAVVTESAGSPSEPTDASQVAHKLDLDSTSAPEAAPNPAEADGVTAAQAELDAAVDARESAEEDLATLISTAALKSSSSLPESRWLITPPSVQGRIGGRPSPGRVAVIGGMSVVSGLAFAWGLGSLSGLRRVNSLPELESLLDLPVVGQLSLDPAGQATSRLALRGRALRGLMLLAEVILGLLVITYLAGVFQNSEVTSGLREDPFATIPQTIVDALRGWW
jgi:hypothetical protein